MNIYIMNKNIIIYILLFVIFILSYKYYKLYIYTLKFENEQDNITDIIYPFNFLFNKKNKNSNYKDKKKNNDKEENKTNLNIEKEKDKEKRTNCYLIDSDDDNIYNKNNIYNDNTYEELFNDNFVEILQDNFVEILQDNFVEILQDKNLENINNICIIEDDDDKKVLYDDCNVTFNKTEDKNEEELTIIKNEDNDIKINIQYLEKKIKPLKNIKFKNLN